MPDPVRIQIRDAAATLLAGVATVEKAPLTATGRGAELPRVFVTVEGEAIEGSAMGGRQARALELVIAAADENASAETLDGSLEDLAAAIETAIGGSTRLGLAGVDALDLIEIEKDTSEAGERPAGVIRLQYAVRYRTLEGAPTAFL